MSLASALVQRVKAAFRRGGVTRDQTVSTGLRDAVASQGHADAAELASRLSTGDLTLTQFQSELYLMTRNAHIAQYALARGSMDALTATDREVLGRLIGEQAGYLRDFAAEIGKGNLTAEQIAQRAALYPESAVAAHVMGQMAALDIDPPERIPAHPNCRCWWTTADRGDTVELTWNTEEDMNVCPICGDNSRKYKAYAVPKRTAAA